MDFSNVGDHESYEGVSLTNPINKANVFYFSCQLKGHYTNEYTNKHVVNSGTQLFMEEILYNSEETGF